VELFWFQDIAAGSQLGVLGDLGCAVKRTELLLLLLLLKKWEEITVLQKYCQTRRGR
jgi:hypothetical protein